MKPRKLFEVDDGTEFETRAECKIYEERESLIDILSSIPTRVLVTMAFDRDQKQPNAIRLADAIERAGAIIAAKRRESGDLKRKRAGAGVDEAIMDRIKDNMKAIS